MIDCGGDMYCGCVGVCVCHRPTWWGVYSSKTSAHVGHGALYAVGMPAIAPSDMGPRFLSSLHSFLCAAFQCAFWQACPQYAVDRQPTHSFKSSATLQPGPLHTACTRVLAASPSRTRTKPLSGSGSASWPRAGMIHALRRVKSVLGWDRCKRQTQYMQQGSTRAPRARYRIDGCQQHELAVRLVLAQGRRQACVALCTDIAGHVGHKQELLGCRTAGECFVHTVVRQLEVALRARASTCEGSNTPRQGHRPRQATQRTLPGMGRQALAESEGAMARRCCSKN